jgi:hypothetical protein
MKKNLQRNLLLTVPIIGIAVFVIFQFSSREASVVYVKEYEETSKAMSELSFPMMDFEDANGRLPASLDEMRQYYASDAFKQTRMPPINIQPDYIDGWGTPLIWGNVFGHPKYKKLIISAGPDREFGTYDDFQEWSWRGTVK